jgi:hypothetical protein
MKNLIKTKHLALFGIIAFITVIGFSMTACTEPDSGGGGGGKTAQKKADEFKAEYNDILTKPRANVTAEDESAVLAALAAFDALDQDVKDLLSAEKAVLDDLWEKIDELKNPNAITSVSIAIEAPVKDTTPAKIEDVSTDDAGYTIYSVAWSTSGGTFTGDKFDGGVVYTVTIELVAKGGFTFTGLTQANTKIGGEEVTTFNDRGHELTISRTFTATLIKSVTGLTINGQPDKLNYEHGDQLDLSGLTVDLTFDDDSSETAVPLAQFGMYGLSTEPVNGATLRYSGLVNHNGHPVVVKQGSNEDNTGNLTITRKPVTITGIGAENRAYDSTNVATITGIYTAVIDGKLANDIVTIDITGASAVFEQINVGFNLDVTFSGFALSGADAGNYTLSAQPESVKAYITLKPITSVEIEIEAPTTGATPDTTATVDGIGYSAGAVLWSPVVVDGTFAALTGYTATFTLTADGNHTFAGLAVSGINIDGDGHTINITGNTGSTVTITCLFPETGDKAVTDLVIKIEPYALTSLLFAHGDDFVLAGIVVELTFTDGSIEDVPLYDFNNYGITTHPQNGSVIHEWADYNNQKVQVRVAGVGGTISVETADNLVIGKKTIDITGVTAVDRVYAPGNTSVVLSGGALQDLVSGDNVTFTLGSGTMANADVGSGKAVTTNIALSGTHAGSYILTQPAGLTVNISKAPGQAVSVPVATEITGNSITVEAITVTTGQTVQYGINTNISDPLTWQTETTFIGLEQLTDYYLFARSLENEYYSMGAVSRSEKVTTEEDIFLGVDIGMDGTYPTNVQNAFNTAIANTEGLEVRFIGTRTGAATTLTINIPAGKTAVWAANLSVTGDTVGVTLSGPGTFEVKSGSISAETGRAILNNVAGTVNVTGGTLSVTTGYAIMNQAAGTVNVSGGTVKSTVDGAFSIAIFNNAGGTINVSGGTISTTTGRAIYNYTYAGTVNITGGTISATTGNAILNYVNGIINISQADDSKPTLITSYSGSATISQSSGGTGDTSTAVRIRISGGTIENTIPENSTINARAIYNTSRGEVQITGGTVRVTQSAAIAIHNQGAGRITISQADPNVPTLITSANTRTDSGTIYLSAAASNGYIEISGGTVQNTANSANAVAIQKDNSYGIIQVRSGSTVITTGQLSTYVIRCQADGILNVSPNATVRAGNGNTATAAVSLTGSPLCTLLTNP